MRISKKILAIALSILMAVSMMPFTVFAATANLSDVLASATGKYVEITDTDIVVDADTTLTGHILDLYGNTTIDLNGHNLVAGATTSGGQEVAIWINPNANVTITDSAQPSSAASYSTTTGDLTIKDGVAAISSTYYGIINEGNLTLGKVVVKGDDNAICVAEGGSLTTTETNSIICGGTYGVTYPGGNATLNLTKGMIYGQYGLSGNSSWDSANNKYKFGGNTINIGTAKIYGKGVDDENNGVINGAAIVLGADDVCNITGSATIIGYDAPAIVTRASAELNVTGAPSVQTYGTLTNVKVLDGATAVPCAPVVVDTACGYTKATDIDVDIAGGTYKANIANVDNAVALVGNSGDETADFVEVTGGTYSTKAGADDVSDLIVNDPTTPDVHKVLDGSGKVVNALVEMDGNYYANATMAMKDVPADNTQHTIKLLDDVSISGLGGVKVLANQNVVFDLNGKTWTMRGTVGSTGSQTNGFQFLQGSTVKIKDGTITAKLASVYTVIQNYGNLTIENATIQYTSSGANKTAVSSNSGNVVIKNSTITGPASTSSFQNQALSVTPGWGGYTAASVVVEDTTINGDVIVDCQAADSTAELEFAGTTNMTRGDIKLPESANGTFELKNTGTGIVAPEGYEWIDSGTTGTKVLTEDNHTVAKIGDVKYDTLEAAWNAAVDGDTITLVKDCNGNGLIAPQGKFGTTGLTVDLNGFTYTVDGTPVGSTGTETIGFQLLKGNKITFKDGTLYGDPSVNNTWLQRMIQNYSDLTLDNVTVDMKGYYYNQITMANCNGTTTIKNGSVVAAPDFTWLGYTDEEAADGLGAGAMTVGTFQGYTEVEVNVENATIDGNLMVDPSNASATKNEVNLGSDSTVTGDIVMQELATDEAQVKKEAGATVATPDGYEWDDNNILQPIADVFNLTVDDCIHMNMYVNAQAYGANTITVTYSDPEKQDGTTKTETFNVADLTSDAQGRYMVTILAAPAQITDEVTITAGAHSLTTSVKAYCDEIIDKSNNAELVELAKTMLDYGKAANAEFNYTDAANFDDYYNTDDVTAALDAAAVVDASQNNGVFTKYSYIVTSVPALRLYTSKTEQQCGNPDQVVYKATVTNLRTNVSVQVAPTVIEGTDEVVIDITNILAENLDDQYTVEFMGGTIKINALAFANAKGGNFGRSMYNYFVAADAYFN